MLLVILSQKSLYNDPNILMISLWGTYSYFNNEIMKIGDFDLMNAAYGSSVSFGSIVRLKSIENNTCTVRRSNLRSKPTPIHGQVHTYDLNYSFSRSHFSLLPQAFSKYLINILSLKVSYAFMIIDPVINGFSTNSVKSDFHIFDHSIVTFGIRG